MIACLLLVVNAVSALGGLHVQMPYPNPAGVTYTTHSAAVPGHLQYQETSSVSFGNGALVGRALPPAGLQYAAPVAHYTAPIAHSSAHFVPTVHHVPGVAQVPVTKYEAQPAVIQNFVDVAKPELASKRIEIRRPAIQKEFYDIEERVLIRPAGSAVVELDQPISKSQKGPTVVQPSAHTVATHPIVGFRALHSHVAPAAYPVSFSVHHYPFQGPTATQVESSSASHHETEQLPEQIPDKTQQEQQLPQEQLPQLPQQEQQQISEIEQQQSQLLNEEQYQNLQQEQQQFDDSDSVAIDNPDIARLRSQENQQTMSQPPNQNRQSLFRNSVQRPMLFAPQPQLSTQLGETLRQRVSEQQDFIARSQLRAQESVVAQLEAQTQAQKDQLARTQQILQLQQQELARSRLASTSFTRASLEQQQPASKTDAQPSLQEENLTSQAPGAQLRTLPAASISSSGFRSSPVDNVIRSSPSPSVIPSFRISAEQSITNQDRLIALLTGHGGAIEARGADGQSSSDSGQVRARVLSVTPAPENASPREEKVNTRRIVVNRPIETLEEVDVVQPFTKIERVAVHSPAVIKTARLGVATLPTSFPVHGYAASLPTIPSY